MKKASRLHPQYSFIASDCPLIMPYSFIQYFFNSSSFFEHSGSALKWYFYIFHEEKKLISASLNLSIKDQKGYSPHKGPFGSLEFDKDIPPEIIMEFWHFFDACCRENQLISVQIKSYPTAYQSENSALLANALVQAGFYIQYVELNQHIIISKKPFLDVVAYSEKKRIKKCTKCNFTFGIGGVDSLEYAYGLIRRSRERKGYPTTMTLEELVNTFQRFPEHYYLFTLRDQEKLIALSVSILVNQHILYNFYHAHDEEYDSYSPIVMVVQGIYSYCQNQNIKILDLGISTANNVLNKGLFRFKKNLGAETSLKLSFIKKLE